MKKTKLNGGCYVLDGLKSGPGPLLPIIGAGFGASHLSQYVLDLSGDPSPIYAFGKSDVILFSGAGTASITVSGKPFEMVPNSGLYVRPGEAFQITPKGRFRCLVTVCPEEDGKNEMKTMPRNFDESFPDRLVTIDPAKVEAMGDRFFQVLVSTNVGSPNVTQFIGEIPKSKAKSHYHLYEEALYVLAGEGLMWTEGKCAPVSAGSIIFLPARQEHALECTSIGGLKVVGHVYPAGSPAENY